MLLRNRHRAACDASRSFGDGNTASSSQHLPQPSHDVSLSTFDDSSYLTVIMPATTSEALDIVNRTVSIAPLVLLSVADHYERSAKGTKKRVVGVLLGQNDSKGIRVSNSFGGTS
jgi:hypothetical protein